MSRVSPVALLLSAWVGAGLLFAAVVAPAAFAVLPSRNLAGELVGRVLPVVFIAGMIVAVAGLLLDRAGSGRFARVRRAALVVVAVSCAAAQFAVAPRIERLRREIGGPIEQLPAGDARRVTFGRLHAASVAWLGLAMIAAATTIVLATIPAIGRATADAQPMAPARL